MKNLEYCYEYSVIWYKTNWQITTSRPYIKQFSLKKEAQEFARKYKKKYPNVLIKPIIIRNIIARSEFRKDVEVEFVDIVKKDDIGEYITLNRKTKEKIIRY